MPQRSQIGKLVPRTGPKAKKTSKFNKNFAGNWAAIGHYYTFMHLNEYFSYQFSPLCMDTRSLRSRIIFSASFHSNCHVPSRFQQIFHLHCIPARNIRWYIYFELHARIPKPGHWQTISGRPHNFYSGRISVAFLFLSVHRLSRCFFFWCVTFHDILFLISFNTSVLFHIFFLLFFPIHSRSVSSTALVHRTVCHYSGLSFRRNDGNESLWAWTAFEAAFFFPFKFINRCECVTQ